MASLCCEDKLRGVGNTGPREHYDPLLLGIPTPITAEAYGLTRLVFEDGFDTIDTIDMNATGAPGFRWYRDRPWMNDGSGNTNMAAISLADSVAQIDQEVFTANYAISTVCPSTGVGQGFQYGYFETRMRFDTSLGAVGVEGFPAFWTLQKEHLTGPRPQRYIEIDIFEAFKDTGAAYDGAFIHTMHDICDTAGGAAQYINWRNKDNWTEGVINSDWHTYGVLWLPGHVSWYLDGQRLAEEEFFPCRIPSGNVIETLTGNETAPIGAFSNADWHNVSVAVILGTGPGWPIEVDWVRVWQ